MTSLDDASGHVPGFIQWVNGPYTSGGGGRGPVIGGGWQTIVVRP